MTNSIYVITFACGGVCEEYPVGVAASLQEAQEKSKKILTELEDLYFRELNLSKKRPTLDDINKWDTVNQKWFPNYNEDRDIWGLNYELPSDESVLTTKQAPLKSTSLLYGCGLLFMAYKVVA